MALDEFHRGNGRYPTEAEGLKALLVNPGVSNWQNPFFERIPDDPWGIPYRYSLGTNGRYEIRSAGRDKRFGTSDDLTN